MKRKIIQISEEKCNGCGACASACHEGAIGMVNGKAALLQDDYCDGLGDCLPACPTGAITFVVREAAAYHATAVAAKRPVYAGGCPGSAARAIARDSAPISAGVAAPTCLRQWPVQIKLAPIHAPYFDGANLLIAADCAAYAYGNFHGAYMRGRITVIGCPKLDGVDYSDKLTAILQSNDVKSVTIARMEVPCCGGLEQAAKTALQNSGKFLPWQVVTISTDGRILD